MGNMKTEADAIPVQEELGVHELDPRQHLVGQHQDGFHGETTRTECKQVLQ